MNQNSVKRDCLELIDKADTIVGKTDYDDYWRGVRVAATIILLAHCWSALTSKEKMQFDSGKAQKERDETNAKAKARLVKTKAKLAHIGYLYGQGVRSSGPGATTACGIWLGDSRADHKESHRVVAKLKDVKCEKCLEILKEQKPDSV